MPPHLLKYRPFVADLNLTPEEESALLQNLWQVLEVLLDHHLRATSTIAENEFLPIEDQSMVLLFNKNNKKEDA